MTCHSVNNNTRMDLVISLCSNSNHLISLIPPKLPEILDIYSVVALQALRGILYIIRGQKSVLIYISLGTFL